MSTIDVDESAKTKEYTIAEMVKTVRKLRGLEPRHRYEEDNIPTEIISRLFFAEDTVEILPTAPVRRIGKHAAELIPAGLHLEPRGPGRHRKNEVDSLYALVNS